jgi:hypothetical protein
MSVQNEDVTRKRSIRKRKGKIAGENIPPKGGMQED